ncbi:squalene--hopene cyclase [Massilia sp. NEAU-DD11]|uniref:Squalene--hopene cyclase n=1 Tax=Massilia cellulosiltytica TaxID=2683234 RepID=A0A7X3K7C6_9BURK|nr:squalene--hopene cyclase [Telluria cellulosilytica]MVW59746.1 squalene--hopene cyclase [Telluria cellulosilytica]
MRYSSFRSMAQAGAVEAERTLTRRARLEPAIDAALAAVLADQRDDGHWVYELEADVTIPAEYVLMVHYLGETPDTALERKIGTYLRRRQGDHGGWPLFHGGAFDPSASVKAYFALKMIGDPPDAPHMARGRSAILDHGGAERSNVFTRMLLALFGEVPWSAVPVMPVEIALLPRWAPFHLSKVSYWTRTVLTPLLVLGALRPRARNPRAVGVPELFLAPPDGLGLAPRAPHQDRMWFALFRALESQMRLLAPRLPARLRRRAVEQAAAFVRARLNGEHGLGAIFPAMVNAVQMLDVLGLAPDAPESSAARRAIDRLLVDHGAEAYCQPCLSPVWDTALMCHALLETGTPRALDAARRGLDWLLPLQILDQPGDWAARRPDVRPGGWAFQYENACYPDVDDTAVVAMAMHRAAHLEPWPLPDRYADAVARAREWIVGMQGRRGGWGAFEADNTHDYLNHIPFADHGALLDPPTADVSARCLSMLAQLEPGACARRRSPAARALGWLLRRQEANGSWYGRWGVNYVYGTWCALCALAAAGLPPEAPPVARAARWLAYVQNPDGGWGEGGDSYRLDHTGHAWAPSTASQTAWALLGLMAAGAVETRAVTRGIAWLVDHQRADGLWDEPQHTATGFPRVFYLRYHGYARYFPLWALARYRNLRAGGSGRVAFGM